jgi:4-hydroxy-tetrahydrodipicolinate synthase
LDKAAFVGCGTALVTPFRTDGSLDETTLRALVRRQIEAGIDFLVPCGTTGESPTLTRQEHLRVVAVAVEETKGEVPVLAGAGGYNTAEVIHLAKEVEALGADGILSVTPYYNKPTQEGLYQHYKAIAASIRIPVVVYNVPGRTGVNVEPSTLKRLTEIDNIYGVKEASGNPVQIARICAENERLIVLSGDDALTPAVDAVGGSGVISVFSNVVPGGFREIWDADSPAPFQRYLPLMDVLFCESNPIPVKAALAAMGLCEPVWRLPLVPPQSANQAKIEGVLRQLELLK